MPDSRGIRLVVLDWAGTTVDHGCFAPVVPFVETLARLGVEITPREARGPMGLGKKDHLRELLRLPRVSAAFQQRHGRPWIEEDVARAYEETFVPVQLECVTSHCELVPGLLEAVEVLRRRGIRIGTTTGYFADAAQKTYAAARRQGYTPDCNVHPGEVASGRPAPWMIFRIMEALDVYPPSAVLKVGDTLPDIAEGRNAGVWSVGVTQTSSEAGLTLEQWQALAAAEQDRLHQEIASRLLAAGADDVIRSVAELPELVDRLNSRLGRGEWPPR